MKHDFSIKTFGLALSVLLIVNAFTGCTQTNQKTNQSSTVQTSAAKPETTPQPPSAANLPPSNFAYDKTLGYQGTMYISGYPKTKKVTDASCKVNCKTSDYVLFELTPPVTITNPAFKQFQKENEGNAYMDTNAIGLGCYQDKTIISSNSTDKSGTRESTLPGTETAKIMNATAKDPIIIKLTREKFTGGSEGTTCYSHFGKIEVK